ncbi:MAG TPA: hypothetical protein VNN80_22365, partial [Polyangiaceae bacterium]|nr:hypothetical protein [Polyangiaceae bacterium]
MANPTSRLRVCLPALAAAFSVLSQLEPAHACGALPCAQVSDVLPPDASVGVPLNTELRVLYFGSLESDDPACSLDLRQMRLLPSEGEPIDLTGSVLERPGGLQAWVVAEPPEPLAPDTTYALQLQLVGGVETCGCGAREWTTVTTFTTGDADDQEAPTFAGIERVSYGERETSS